MSALWATPLALAPWLATPLLATAGVLADRLIPEPRRRHPLAAFGALAGAVERRLNTQAQLKFGGRLRGLLGVALLVLPPTLLVIALDAAIATGPLATAAPIVSLVLSLILNLVLLWFALGARSLEQHAARVAHALNRDHLTQARHRVSWLVSRDSADMDRSAVARATIESVLENGNDAIFAPLFWFLIAGAPGALAFRLLNTLDAMWGYRTERLRNFGWAAARLDDLMGWVPARLTAFSYAALGHSHQALRCWRQQAQLLDSPNGGPSMVSGAAALGIRLGGPAHYHGQLRDKPWFGAGAEAAPDDIGRALTLVRHSLWLWLTLALLAALAWALVLMVAGDRPLA